MTEERIVATDGHQGHWYTGEEIVRCRDCEHFVLGSNDYATVDWCDYWEAINLSSDGFCAWGERKAVE